LAKSILIEFGKNETLPLKNVTGKAISYERSFASKWYKIFGCSRHTVYSIITAKQHRLLRGLLMLSTVDETIKITINSILDKYHRHQAVVISSFLE
jgi:hypothetical protein